MGKTNKNRYMLVAKNLGYSDYIKTKYFPSIFSKTGADLTSPWISDTIFKYVIGL